MNKLILNFFGDEVTIVTPKNLEYLKKEISSKFCFSPSDAAEVIVSYFVDLKKIIIKTEQDFIDFIKQKIYKIDLDISQESQLYKKNMQDILDEKETGKKELEEMIKLNEELETRKENYIQEKNNEIKHLEEQIKLITLQKNNICKEINKEKMKINSEISKNKAKIFALQKKLSIPIKKENKKVSTPNPVIKLKGGNPQINKNKKIHTGIYCNGCGADKIIGNRFKCAICPNFDYCEKCERINKDKHLHPFIKIYSPETAPIDIKCDLNKI